MLRPLFVETHVCPHCAVEVDAGHVCPNLGTALAPTEKAPARDVRETALAVASTVDPSIHASSAESEEHLSKPLGVKLGRYVVEALIGRGGMGAVYRARHEQLESCVAIKVMDRKIIGSHEAHARFLREAKAAAKIDHPNVIKILDQAEHPSLGSYLVMELLVGTGLDQVLSKEGPLDVARAVDIALQIADALAAAHEHGIVHRDLKPANVHLARIRGQESVTVMDFGVAKLGPENTTLLTRPGAVVGTPLYMSPEQWDNGAVDSRSDVYGFGVLLYEMLTGELPVRGRIITEVARNLALVRPTPPRELRKEIPVALDAAVMRCLEKAPAARFASMRDVEAALRESLGPHRVARTSYRVAPVVALAALAFAAALGLGWAGRFVPARAGATADPPPVVSAAMAEPSPTVLSPPLAVASAPDAGGVATPIVADAPAPEPVRPAASAKPARPAPVRPARPGTSPPDVLFKQ